MNTFPLDPGLEELSAFVMNLSLCQVRLYNNASFPWIMLIPHTDVIEIVDLNEADQQILMKEICQASTVMRQLYSPKKLNVASLGNVVPQIHVHVVARYENDGAWPRPVWYSGVESAYSADEKAKQITLIKNAFDQLRMQ
jgi:diadenosine tetraphosphate (Ap4A) HIT family hydrolase